MKSTQLKPSKTIKVSLLIILILLILPEIISAATDGTKKWSFPNGYSSSSPAVAPDGTIYVGGRTYKDNQNKYFLYAVNPDGTQNGDIRPDFLWTLLPPSGPTAPSISAVAIITSTPLIQKAPANMHIR